MLEDQPSFYPDEDDMLDSELDFSQEPPFNCTMDAIADEAVKMSNTTPADLRRPV